MKRWLQIGDGQHAVRLIASDPEIKNGIGTIEVALPDGNQFLLSRAEEKGWPYPAEEKLFTAICCYGKTMESF